jgi:hypothetical protein
MTNPPLTLPDSYLSALRSEAQINDMSLDAALKCAIRLYQHVNKKQREGLRLAFIDAQGTLVQEPVFGCPALD